MEWTFSGINGFIFFFNEGDYYIADIYIEICKSVSAENKVSAFEYTVNEEKSR